MLAVDNFSELLDYPFMPSEKWWRGVLAALSRQIAIDFGIEVDLWDSTIHSGCSTLHGSRAV